MHSQLVVAFLTGLAVIGCGSELESNPVATERSSERSSTEAIDEGAIPPPSYLRFGADGLTRVRSGGEERLVDGPIRLATSDGAGGVLYTEWATEMHEGSTWWLPADRDEARVVSDGTGGIPARLDGRTVVVGSFPTGQCQEDSVDSMVARDLVSGADTLLQCGTGGPDDGSAPNSYGGGLYVGDHWSAVLDRGALMSSIDLVFRDERGEVIDHPANPYDGDCHPCELTAGLSPDGTRLAVIHRPDALRVRDDNWEALTSAIPARVQVFDLASGLLVFEQEVSSGARPTWEWHPWFDGRHVVLGPDRFEHPALQLGDHGPAVSTLQRLLADTGADIEVDGAFGPATESALEAFHAERFGTPRPTAQSDTWTALGVPDTIIDTHAGSSIEVAGSVALEVVLAAGPVDVDDDEPPRLRPGDTGEWVAVLQQHLIRHGYSIEVDGVFGPATGAAVRDFQTAHDLDDGGIVGPNTWTALTGVTTGPPTSLQPAATTTPDPDLDRVAAFAGRLEYITYGKDGHTGLFGVTEGDGGTEGGVVRIVDQPIEWAADDGDGGIVYRPAGAATDLHLPAGASTPVPVGADFPVRDPRTGGGLSVSAERTIEETSSWAVHHERLIFRDLAGNPVAVAHNPWPRQCEDHCRLDAMLSPDGELLAVHERVLRPGDLGVTNWSEPVSADARWRAALEIPARLRIVSLTTGDEILARDLPEGSLVDFDGDRLIFRVGAPGHQSQFPGAYHLVDVPDGTEVAIHWVTAGQPVPSEDMSIHLIARRRSSPSWPDRTPAPPVVRAPA